MKITGCLAALLLAAGAPARGAAVQEGARTVWDRIMEEQGAVNLRRGYAFMRAENYPAAADEFFKASQKTPSSPWPRLSYGSALYWLGEPAKALSEFEAALQLDPRNSMAFQLRGIARARAGQYDAALKDFLEASRLSPERADVRMNAGSVCHVTGDFAGALNHFRAAVALDGTNPLYRYQLGLFYSRLGRYEEAADELEKAVSLFNGYEDAVLELAVLREREGRVNEAIKLYRRALALKPGDSVARFRLALALGKAGRHQELRKALTGAFLIAPANDNGGISMTAAYASPSSEGSGVWTGQENPLFGAVSRIPPDQDAKVVLELLELPKQGGLERGGRDGAKLASALSRPKVKYTKREYFLPAAPAEERAKRAAEIAAEAEKLQKEVPQGSESRLSFNLETSRSARGRERAEGEKPKALYKPRDVGNDMGLWIMGDNWVENVGEGLEELEEIKPDAWPGFRLVRGLGRLLLGEAEEALSDFAGGGPQEAGARSAAWTAAGDTGKALAACLEALKQDPSDKTALANRKWLEVKK